ncbi:fimbrial protein [Providencia rettgeri]
MKKVIIGVCVSGMISSSALAVDQGHGKVTFKGEIIDAPCSISADSVDQTVELGQIANSILANGGASSPKQFTIELEDCVFPNNAGVKYNDKVQITFSGASAGFNPKLLGVTGLTPNDALVGNVGIQITDTQGMPIDMGVSTSQAHQLQEGSNTLQYSAFMRGANVAVDAIPL